MKRFIRLMAAFTCACVLAAPARAADDPKEAIAMVKKAVAHLKAHGKDAALADFNQPAPQFKKGAYYIFVTSVKGQMLANGSNAKLVGKELMDLKDADGKLFVKEYIELASAKGQGWVDYKWINPDTKAIDNKSAYVEKFGDLVVGCGIYKN